MDALEAIKNVSISSGKTYATISKSLGKNRGYINTMYTNDTIPNTETLISILGVCDYALCAIPKEKITDDMLVISNKQKR